jgi:hypothetical protein
MADAAPALGGLGRHGLCFHLAQPKNTLFFSYIPMMFRPKLSDNINRGEELAKPAAFGNRHGLSFNQPVFAGDHLTRLFLFLNIYYKEYDEKLSDTNGSVVYRCGSVFWPD